MAWSDLKSEVVFVLLLHMRIVNMAQHAYNLSHCSHDFATIYSYDGKQ